MAEASSRLCVKNIPGYVDEARLREYFGEKGDITDARVIRASDGHSRQFGFVGFKSADEAEHALEYFNNSYMDSSRLSIQFAYQRGAEAAPQAWSKYTPGTSAHSRAVAVGSVVAQAVSTAPADLKAKKRKRQGPEEDDPALQEFLQAMQPRSKAAIWSNDVTATPAKSGPAKSGPAKSQGKKVGAAAAVINDSDNSDDEYADLPAGTAVPTGASEGSDSEDSKGAQYQDAAVGDDAVSDMDYLRSRMRSSGPAAEDDDGEGGSDEDAAEEDDVSGATSSGGDGSSGGDATKALGSNGTEGRSRAAEATATAVKEDLWDHEADEGAADEERRRSDEEAGPRPEVVQATDAADQIGETGRLFLRNLSYAASEDDLSQLLVSYGELKEVHLVVDRSTRKSKGIALVQFTEAADAVAAHAALDATVFQGRLLHVLPGHRPPPSKEQAPGGGTFKEQREAQRRETGGNRASWNALYMRPDTVAEAMAAQLGVTKGQLLDSSHDDLAVRQALGEARVLAATKSALGDAGVAIDELEAAAAAAGHSSGSSAIKRSATTLLVKNLPFQVTEDELQDMFGKRGAISRMVLPETRGLALVEYEAASEARAAFRGLAYRRLHHVPLYLEWAPAGIWTRSAPLRTPEATMSAAAEESGAADGGGNEKEGDRVAAAAAVHAAADLGGAADAKGDGSNDMHTLFVKNLAWKTGDAVLRRTFEKVATAAGGSVRSAKVAVRSDKKAADGKALSMGFGFVECSTAATAQALLKKLQGTTLDGHKLLIQLSQHKRAAPGGGNKGEARDGKAAPKAAATKLVVRNVAFEASRKDIVGLFAPYGQIKSARLPNKFDGQHRGFAFVEFGSKQEAAAAMEATAGTHLYGRRLVVETAGEDAGLDELRAKTAAKFHDDDAEDARAAKRLRQKLQMAEADGAEGGEGSEKKQKKKRKKAQAAS